MASDATTQAFLATLNDIQVSAPITKLLAGLKDAVGENYPILKYMNDNCKEPLDGGGLVEWKIRYNLPDATGYWGPSDVESEKTPLFKDLSLPRSAMSIGIVYYRTDKIQNKGPDAQLDYVAQAIDAAKDGFSKRLALNLHGNGTNDANGTAMVGPAGHHIYGLQYGLPDDPTAGTYAGHTRDATDDTRWLRPWNTTLANLNALDTNKMEQLYGKCSRDGKSPDLIVCSAEGYRRIKVIAQSDKWFDASQRERDLSFPESIKFKNANIIPTPAMTIKDDGGLLDANIDRIYFLNTKDGMSWMVDPSEDMALEGPMERTEQHTYIQYMYWNGQYILTMPNLNGIFHW